MGHAGFYIRANADGWQLIDLSAGDPTRLESPASQSESLDQKGILDQLDHAGGAGSQTRYRILIGVPADWCLSAAVSAEGLPKASSAQRLQALTFRMEAILPINAEEHAIAFVGSRAEEDRLGIAVRADRLTNLVQALEDSGHDVVAILPRALLAARTVFQGQPADEVEQPAGLIWQEGRGVDREPQTQMLLIDQGKPLRWRLIETSDLAIAQQIDLDELHAQPDRAWHVTPELEQSLTHALQPEANPTAIQTIDPADQLERNGAQAILGGGGLPWVDLRVGPLAPTNTWRRLRLPATACAAATVILLVTLIALLWVRAGQYDEMAQHFDQQAAERFRQAMPGQTVPVSPQRRLNTRLQQLRGEQGLAGDEQDWDQTPALVHLHQSLAALPDDQRYTITDLRLEDGRLRLTGQARTHGEADQIANALRLRSAFVVDPPSTDNLPDQGVRFVIDAVFAQPVQQVDAPAGSATLAGSRAGGTP